MTGASTRAWYLAAILTTLAVTSVHAAELPFREPVVVDSTLSLASSVTSADLDLDGDGDLDLAGADLLAGRVLVWESLLAVFADGFESGETDAWSSATPTRRGRP